MVEIFPFFVLKINFEILIKLETFCKRSFLIRGLEVEGLIPFPDWIIPFPVLKTNFEILEKNLGLFLKDVLLLEALFFSVYPGQSHFISKILCLSWAISDYLKLSRTFSDHPCPSRSILVYFWLSLAITGYPKLPRATMSYLYYLWLSLVLSGYLGPSQDTSLKYQVSGCK